MEGKYKEFRDLLKYGIGNTSISAFAEKAGVSRAVLSKMLNSDEIPVPREDTIFKIADAMDGRVSRDKLLKACGYAITDISGNLLEEHNNLKTAVNEYILAEDGVFDDIKDHILDMVKRLYMKHDITWYVDHVDDEKTTMKKIVVSGRWSEGDYNYRFIFGMAYVETSDNRVCVTRVYTEFNDLMKFCPDDYVIKLIKEHSDFRAVSKEAVGYAERIRKNDDYSSEGILLRAIFGYGGKEKYYVSIPGVGFMYPKTPSGFVDFLNKYRGEFCINQENIALYQRVINGEDPDEVFKDYSSRKLCDKNYKGTAEVVAFIASKVTGVEFEHIAPEGEENDNCVAYGMLENGIDVPVVSSLLIDDVRDMAVVLKVPSCGIIYHKFEMDVDTRVYGPDDVRPMDATVSLQRNVLETVRDRATEWKEKEFVEDDKRSYRCGRVLMDVEYLLNKYKGQNMIPVPIEMYNGWRVFINEDTNRED